MTNRLSLVQSPCTTSGLEMERVNSYNPGAHTGLILDDEAQNGWNKSVSPYMDISTAHNTTMFWTIPFNYQGSRPSESSLKRAHGLADPFQESYACSRPLSFGFQPFRPHDLIIITVSFLQHHTVVTSEALAAGDVSKVSIFTYIYYIQCPKTKQRVTRRRSLSQTYVLLRVA